MLKRLLLAALLFVSLPAFAANLTWTHPTTYTDGSPLAVADVASTTIEYSNTSPFGTVAGQVVITGSATTGVAPNPANGTTRCYRTLTTVVAAKGGATSVPSNISCLTAPFPAPNPPTIIQAILAWLKSFFGHFA